MAYTSDELTHFLGRSLPSDDERFELLCRVIDGGVLLDPSHINRRDGIFMAGLRDNETGEIADAVEYSSVPNVRHDMGSRVSDNRLIQFEIVCFCDIPLNELGVHCSKYGRFGLSFSKLFLVKQGASPVMYVPTPGAFRLKLEERHRKSGELFYEEEKNGTRAQAFDSLYELHNRLGLLRHRELEGAMTNAPDHDVVDGVVRDLRTMLFYQTGIEATLFGYLKFYDPALPLDHPDNYYMEREWRVNGRVKFAVSDLQRVLVPPEYIERTLDRFPELGSALTPVSAG
jgi:hypothetical protein